jgi:Flp pilus assembly protein TadD
MPAFSSAWVPFERARALVALGDDAGAVVAYRAALDVDARHVRAQNDLGLLCARHGLNAEAEAYFRGAISADPDNAIARANLGAMLLRRGAEREALEHFGAALIVAPEFEPARKGFAAASAALGLPAGEA